MKLKNQIRTLLLLLALAFMFSNCGTIKRTSLLVNESDSIKIGYGQLKLLLITFYDSFSSTTEESANYIMKNTNDIEVKKMALRWKINAISEARRSFSIPDPFASLIDTRAYCYQLNQFFVSGAGRNYFGEYQYVAVEASENLIKGIDNIALQAISQAKFDRNQPEFLEWVSANPITGAEFSRESTISLFVDYIGDDTKDLTSSLGSIEETLTDIRSRLTLYSQSLPKQAQWQAELMIEENMEREEITRVLEDFDTVAVALNRINNTIDELDIILGKIVGDSFREVDRQRLATLEELKSERQLIVDLLRSERQILLDAISTERQKTIDDARKLSNELLSGSGVIMYDIVDHVFYRILQLSAIFGIVLIGAVYILKRIKKT